MLTDPEVRQAVQAARHPLIHLRPALKLRSSRARRRLRARPRSPWLRRWGRGRDRAGLPTGRTPIPLYDALAARHERGAIDLSGPAASTSTSWCCRPRPADLPLLHGAPRLGPHRPEAGALRHPGRAAPDLEAECRRYEGAIEAAGGLDLACWVGRGRPRRVQHAGPDHPAHPRHPAAGRARGLARRPAGGVAAARAHHGASGPSQGAPPSWCSPLGRQGHGGPGALVRGPEDPAGPAPFSASTPTWRCCWTGSGLGALTRRQREEAPARYCAGVFPVQRLNERWNALASEKPRRKAASPMARLSSDR